MQGLVGFWYLQNIFNVSLSVSLCLSRRTHPMGSNNHDIALEAKFLKEKRNENAREIVEQLNSSNNEEITIKDMIQAEQIDKGNIKDVNTVKDNLNENFFGRIKNKMKTIELPQAAPFIYPLLIGIVAYFMCCSCGQNDCYGPVLLALPIIVSKKALCWTLLNTINLLEKIPCEEDTENWTSSELMVVIQDEESKGNMLFWILLAISAEIGLALIGILVIMAIIAGIVQLMKKQKDQTLLRINEDGKWVYGGSKSSNVKAPKDERKTDDLKESIIEK